MSYRHTFAITFKVTSDYPDADDVTPAMLLQAILQQCREATASDWQKMCVYYRDETEEIEG